MKTGLLYLARLRSCQNTNLCSIKAILSTVSVGLNKYIHNLALSLLIPSNYKRKSLILQWRNLADITSIKGSKLTSNHELNWSCVPPDRMQ